MFPTPLLFLYMKRENTVASRSLPPPSTLINAFIRLFSFKHPEHQGGSGINRCSDVHVAAGWEQRLDPSVQALHLACPCSKAKCRDALRQKELESDLQSIFQLNAYRSYEQLYEALKTYRFGHFCL